MNSPLGLLAELTHRCPLSCPYCSNPIELAARSDELAVEEWERIMGEAGAMGVVQTGISGGEPLAYAGLERVVCAARRAGIYTNLITSGVGLDDRRARDLRDHGLEAVQISFQSDMAGPGNRVAGADVHEKKVAAARATLAAGLPLGVNVVLHRENIDRLPEIIRLAVELGAMRLELANVQFLGWAFANRTSLLPTRDQIVRASEVASREAGRLRGQMHVIYVVPDYFEKRPKPCLHGWGSRGITVNPRGDVMPCQAADAIPGMQFANIRERSLEWIWNQSDAFNRFRGTDWMREPCRTCDFRELDFGGCRCQAALLTGDPANADPVCEFSPARGAVERMIAEANSTTGSGWIYRSRSNRRAATSEGEIGSSIPPNSFRT